MEVAVVAEFVALRGDLLTLAGEGVDRVSGGEPGGLDVVLRIEVQQAGYADHRAELTAGHVGGAGLVEAAHPQGLGVEIGAEVHGDLLALGQLKVTHDGDSPCSVAVLGLWVTRRGLVAWSVVL